MCLKIAQNGNNVIKGTKTWTPGKALKCSKGAKF